VRWWGHRFLRKLTMRAGASLTTAVSRPRQLRILDQFRCASRMP
jgi:hypothetical protein